MPEDPQDYVGGGSPNIFMFQVLAKVFPRLLLKGGYRPIPRSHGKTNASIEQIARELFPEDTKGSEDV